MVYLGLWKYLSKEESPELGFELRLVRSRRPAGSEFQTDGATKLNDNNK